MKQRGGVKSERGRTLKSGNNLKPKIMEALIETPRCAKNMEMIKAQLEAGKVITVLSVQRTVHTSELRHYVSKIKEFMEIESEWCSDAKGRRFKKYWKKKAA